METPSLSKTSVDLHFRRLHDLLDVRSTRHHMGLPDAASPDCLVCRPPAPPETVLHLFAQCRRTSVAWHLLFFKATMALGTALTDQSLLYLAWPPTTARVDVAVTLAIITYTHWAWSTCDMPDQLTPYKLQALVREEASHSLFQTIL